MEVTTNARCQTLSLENMPGDSRSDHVRDVFEDSSHYLETRRVDIRFRKEAVKTFAGGVQWRKLLDIGCGDGTISIQLLTGVEHLTLLDLSSNMAALARRNTPKELASNVTVRNDNFMTASFDTASFDLIVAVGVLAHVDSPDAFLAKIRESLRPGGHLIVEFTDAYHFVGTLGRVLDRFKEMVAPARYPTNKLSNAMIFALFRKHKLKTSSVFRYSRIPLPLVHRFISSALQYRIGKLIFGIASKNTNAFLGNEYVCLLKAE